MLQRNEQAFDVQVVAQERMTRFVSDASHELRTPLAAIRGYGELYRMGGVPPERTDEVMGRIESEASRMGRLVDDLLQLARMDEGREMTMEQVDLTAIAAGALTDMMVLSPQRDCELIPFDDDAAASGKEAPSVTVIGDKDRLSQVMTNLLGNVVRHTPENSSVEVAVGLGPESTVARTQLAGQAVGGGSAGEPGAGTPLRAPAARRRRPPPRSPPEPSPSSRCGTTARGCPTRTWRRCSDGSTGRTPPATGRRADQAWGWRSSWRSSSGTAARCAWAEPRAAARRSISRYPLCCPASRPRTPDQCT